LRPTLLIAVAMSATACSPTRTVEIGWDVPAVAPDAYRIFVDDRMVLNIPPPSVNRACDCLLVSVPVPRGRHIVRVVAYNRSGDSTPASITVP
jgi:hypothetical protein